uniref:hypothetical protein n=1 Tax=Candidatus Wunengus sp. YC63 TaxID=3367699 RepID=UPI004024C1D4
MNNNNWYTINIPIYDSNNQPGGAQSGEAALIHVFLSGNELDVNSPANGQITVGEPGSITQIDVVAQSRTPTPTQTPTPSTPTPVPTPVTSPNPTVCEVDRITVSKTSLKLKRKKSGTVTVAVTGDDGCAVEGETVTATINAAGKKRISVSPTSASTDENGQESFTVTARKTGNARITFKAGRVKKSITVKIKK